jgi:arabinan endo-1,5-alpha-L-arabinosidase
VDDYVKTSNNLFTKGNITIAAWVVYNDTDGSGSVTQMIQSFSFGMARTLNIGCSPNVLCFGTDVSSDWPSRVVFDGPLTIGRSYYIVGVLDNYANLRVYVNGVLNASRTLDPTKLPNDITAPVYIGGDGVTSWSIYGGIIDEVRIYNRALSDSEIKALYESTR